MRIDRGRRGRRRGRSRARRRWRGRWRRGGQRPGHWCSHHGSRRGFRPRRRDFLNRRRCNRRFCWSNHWRGRGFRLWRRWHDNRLWRGHQRRRRRRDVRLWRGWRCRCRGFRLGRRGRRRRRYFLRRRVRLWDSRRGRTLEHQFDDRIFRRGGRQRSHGREGQRREDRCVQQRGSQAKAGASVPRGGAWRTRLARGHRQSRGRKRAPVGPCDDATHAANVSRRAARAANPSTFPTATISVTIMA
jgi:hypothetical protein